MKSTCRSPCAPSKRLTSAMVLITDVADIRALRVPEEDHHDLAFEVLERSHATVLILSRRFSAKVALVTSVLLNLATSGEQATSAGTPATQAKVICTKRRRLEVYCAGTDENAVSCHFLALATSSATRASTARHQKLADCDH